MYFFRMYAEILSISLESFRNPILYIYMYYTISSTPIDVKANVLTENVTFEQRVYHYD